MEAYHVVSIRTPIQKSLHTVRDLPGHMPFGYSRLAIGYHWFRPRHALLTRGRIEALQLRVPVYGPFRMEASFAETALESPATGTLTCHFAPGSSTGR
jgi:hypothetical protein